jgi:hypothetical protein
MPGESIDFSRYVHEHKNIRVCGTERHADCYVRNCPIHATRSAHLGATDDDGDLCEIVLNAKFTLESASCLVKVCVD